VSSRGTVVIPRAVRQALGLRPGDWVEFVSTPSGIVMKPGRRAVPRNEFDVGGETVPVSEPVMRPPMRPAAPAVGSIAPRTDKLPLVLVVDDSAVVRKVAQRLLERAGLEVVLATDGVDALAQLQRLTPHAMLVDIEMPRMDGLTFTRTVRATPFLAHIPIIIISSHVDAAHRDAARDLGVEVYLGKPYEERELVEHVRRFVRLAVPSA
jgi:AbrB family looped-hinge helix DNA binding protein